jgi:putative transposase
VKFNFVEAEKAHFPVAFMCAQFGVSTSGYYASRSRATSARSKDEAKLVEEVRAVHGESRCTYGSPRVHATLKAAGRNTSRKRVARIMREQELVARRKKRFRRTTDSNHPFPIAPNLVARNFTANAPNKVWVTDITYVWTREWSSPGFVDSQTTPLVGRLAT